MALDHADKDFRHEGVSYLDYKQVEMDRVLTAFLARLWWGGQSSVISRDPRTRSPRGLRRPMMRTPESVPGFDPAVTKPLGRDPSAGHGEPGKAQPGRGRARPLHGFTYRFRNARRSRAYNADEQLYEMLSHADEKGRYALAQLKDFFFAGVDPHTEAPRLGDDVDVETQALISLSEILKLEITDRASGARRRSYPPLYARGVGPAGRRYRPAAIPPGPHPAHGTRRVPEGPVRVPPGAVPAEDHEAAARDGPRGQAHALGRRVLPRRHGLAGQRPGHGWPSESAATWYDRIPAFVTATFTVKKLNDLATISPDANPRLRPPGGFQVSDLLLLLGSRYRQGAQSVRECPPDRDRHRAGRGRRRPGRYPAAAARHG